MAELYRMQDLPIEHIRYLYNNPNYIILMEKYFIKRLRNQCVNTDVFLKIADLNIKGFNNHKRVYSDDCEEFIYLNAPYLGDHTDMIDTLQDLKIEERLKSFKFLLTQLNLAHQKDFNPFNISFSNYLMSPERNPIFTSFGLSFYEGKSTCVDIPSTIFTLNNFVKTVNIKDPKVLNLNDKMLALKMLFQALSNSYEWINTSDINILRNSYNAFKSKCNIDPKIDEYIQSILYEYNPPEEDDYFIDTIINPLLEGGLELKKTAN